MDYRLISRVIYNNSDKELDFEIIDTGVDLTKEVEERVVVRGISFRGNKILVVYPNDDVIYGTPGGGIEPGEDQLQALKREMLEEVGAKKIRVLRYLGQMKTYRKQFHKDTVFAPLHHFYLIDIEEFGEQELIHYEKTINLKFDFIDLDEAIETNEKVLAKRNYEHLDFYTNQTILFKELKKRYFK